MKRAWLLAAAAAGLMACAAVVLAQGGAAIVVPQPASRSADYAVPASRPTPDYQINELLNKWKSTEDSAIRKQIEDEMRAALQEQFRTRLEQHEREVQALEARVKQLRDQVDLRRQKQDEIVDFRLQQLLREAQGLGWGDEPAGTRYSPSDVDMFRAPGGYRTSPRPMPVQVAPSEAENR